MNDKEQMYIEELRQYWLDPTIDYPEPYYVLEYNGVGFFPLGGVQAVSGQKKNGKSFVLTQLMAAVLGSGTSRVRKYLSGLECPQRTKDYIGHEPIVLYVDTEMEKLYSAKVLRRVHWLCGWDLKERSSRFYVLWLRTVPNSETQSANRERWRLIKNAIYQVSPDVVVIDGIRDLVNNFNDPEESYDIIIEMMNMASRRNMCIMNTLHMNPRPSNDDESKMRGHLGTELGNKVSDTLVCIKKKHGTDVTFTVSQPDARSKDVDDWKFIVTDDAGDLGIPMIIDSGHKVETPKPSVLTDEIISKIQKMLSPNGLSLKYGKLREGLGLSKDDNDLMNRIIAEAIDKEIIFANKDNFHTVYSLNQKYRKDE